MTELGESGGEGFDDRSACDDGQGDWVRFESHHVKLFLFGRAVGEFGEPRLDSSADLGLAGASTSICNNWWFGAPLLMAASDGMSGWSTLMDSSSKVVLRAGRLNLLEGLAAPVLMTDDMLPVTEWPRMVDIELSVSEDMVESGRMYSTRSEKPTRARDGGLRCGVGGTSMVSMVVEDAPEAE
jgi:hypothetical protein